MNKSIDIIKYSSQNQAEQFVRQRLHNSIVAACLSVRVPEGQAETTAHAVCDGVIVWLRQRPEVTSQDIRTVATRHLKSYHPEAAYLYEQHYLII